MIVVLSLSHSPRYFKTSASNFTPHRNESRHALPCYEINMSDSGKPEEPPIAEREPENEMTASEEVR